MDRPQPTHCKHGHAYDASNVRIINGRRSCQVCHRLSGRKPSPPLSPDFSEETRQWAIYRLRDPRIKDEKVSVRYVGVVRDRKREKGDVAIAERLKEHIYAATKNENRPVCKWIGKLLMEGIKPVMDVIDRGVGATWEAAEQKAIAECRIAGYRLLNLKAGGAKREYRPADGETRLKLSMAASGRKVSSEEREMRKRSARLGGNAAFSVTGKARTIQGRASLSRVLNRTARMLLAGAEITTPDDFHHFGRALGGSVKNANRTIAWFDSFSDFLQAARAFCWEDPVVKFQIPRYVRNVPVVGTDLERALISAYNRGESLGEIADSLNAAGFRTLGYTGPNKLHGDQLAEVQRLCREAEASGPFTRAQATKIGALFGLSFGPIMAVFKGHYGKPKKGKPWIVATVHKQTKKMGLDTEYRIKMPAEMGAEFKAAYQALDDLPRSPVKTSLYRVLKTSSPEVVALLEAALLKADAAASESPSTLLHDDSDHADDRR